MACEDEGLGLQPGARKHRKRMLESNIGNGETPMEHINSDNRSWVGTNFTDNEELMSYEEQQYYLSWRKES